MTVRSTIKYLHGRKGGKGGGGSSRSPIEEPNSLRSRSLVRFVDVISEGPIRGLVNGNKSIYLDDTPLQNEDGSYNFAGVTIYTRDGTPTQDYIPGFSDAETEKPLNVKVTTAIPATFAVNDATVNAVRVKVRIPSLVVVDNTTGDQRGTTVTVAFDVKTNSGSYVQVATMTITGKTTSPYERAIRLELPPGGDPWTVRVRRITADSGSSLLSNDTFVSTYTEVVDAKLNYPDSAIVAGAVDAQLFGTSVPTRKYHFYGIESEIPSNYDPETRTYSGFWDGTFTVAYHNNPAWVLWALMTNTRFGCGDILSEVTVDKFALYSIAQYCDELVPDGAGGLEPRYTFNGVINSQDDAAKVLDALATVFRGMIYWGAGAVVTTIDAPSDPVKIVTPANIIGDFEYMGAAQKSRSSIIQVAYSDPALLGGTNYVVVQRDDLIRKFGERRKTVPAIGCNSRSQATRHGEWILDTEEYETEVVSYTASLDNADLRPGQIIAIADPDYMGIRYGGRIIAASTTSVTIDAPVDIEAYEIYQVTLTLPDGEVVTRQLNNSAGAGQTVLTWASALSATPQVASLWAMSSSSAQPRKFRVISNTEKEENKYLIVALFHDPTKYDRIERDRVLPEPAYSALPTGRIEAPTVLTATEFFTISQESAVVLSWTPSVDSRTTGYEVQYKDGDDTDWSAAISSTSPSVDIGPTTPGVYQFRVRAIGLFSPSSAWVELSQYVYGQDQPLGQVQGFKISVNGPVTTLSWDALNNPNLAGYVLRYNTEVVGASFEASQVMIAAISPSTTVVTVPTRTGSYFIKGFTPNGTESAAASLVTCEIAAVEGINVVATIQEDPTFSGTHSGTVVNGSNQLRINGSGGGTATYTFANSLNLGAVYSINLTASLVNSILNLANVMASWPTLSAVSSMAGTFAGQWSTKIYMRTTQTDPTGSPVWSAWEEFTASTKTFWGAQFKIELYTSLPNSTPLVDSLAITADVLDRISGAPNVSCPSGGLTVTFDQAFMATPTVHIDGQGLNTGDYHRVTSKSATGFTVQFFNSSGTGVARTFDWVAKGYGYRQ